MFRGRKYSLVRAGKSALHAIVVLAHDEYSTNTCRIQEGMEGRDAQPREQASQWRWGGDVHGHWQPELASELWIHRQLWSVVGLMALVLTDHKARCRW